MFPLLSVGRRLEIGGRQQGPELLGDGECGLWEDLVLSVVDTGGDGRVLGEPN